LNACSLKTTGTRLRIFISAVTGEFGKARDALAADLRTRGHEVTVQSDFTQSPDSETLLGNLSDYIRDCHAVVCIVGKRCGVCPPARAAERLKGVLPDDIKEASYTQWQFFLARHFKRRPYLYIAGDSYFYCVMNFFAVTVLRLQRCSMDIAAGF
jgi:hypothetical protein